MWNLKSIPYPNKLYIHHLCITFSHCCYNSKCHHTWLHMLMHWAEIRCLCDDSPEQNHNFRWCHGQVVASQQDTSDLYEISEDYSSVADHLQNKWLISKILRVLLTTCYNMLQAQPPGPKPPRPPGHSKGTTVVQTLQLSFSSFWWPGNFGKRQGNPDDSMAEDYHLALSVQWFDSPVLQDWMSWQCPKYPDCSEAISGRVILAPCQRPQQ